MNDEEKALFKRLLDATKAGECPDPDCKICKEKWAAIEAAKKFIEEATEEKVAPSVRLNNLRVDFWEDESGEKVVSRTLNPQEVNKVVEELHDLLLGDDGAGAWEDLYLSMFPDDPRWGEITWDEEVVYGE